MAYVKFNRKKTKLGAIDAASTAPDTIYFTKESDEDTSGAIIVNGINYSGVTLSYVDTKIGDINTILTEIIG